MFDFLLSLDPQMVAIGAGGLVVVAVIAVIVTMFSGQLGSRSNFRKRLALVSRRGGGGGRERAGRGDSRRREMQEKLRQIEDGKKSKKSRRHQIVSDIQQSGLSISVRQYAIGSLLLGLVGAAAIMLLGYHFIAALLVGVFLGMAFPKYYLNFMRKRRLKAFTLQFANALDIIIRGIQSGLPVGECLAIIGRESSEPTGPIFQEIVENIKIGLTLEEALDRALERIASQELRFFSIVLQIQQTTGGNLAETLQNLSTVLRDRKKMRDKIKAMASEANASAAIIGSLPFLITLALALVNPTYISVLFTDDVGNILIAIGLTWMTIGVIVMRQMINFDI